MAVALNRKGVRFARARIASGDVDQTSAWSFRASDANRLLGDPPNWDRFGRYFLAVDTESDPQTRQHYKYPFGKLRGGRFIVFRSALRAAITRAAQQGATQVERAARSLLQSLPEPQQQQVTRREQRVCERIALSPDDAIDLENKVIRDAALLGSESANGYVYTREAMMAAAKLLDGAKVFLNHREIDGNNIRPHDVRDYVGRVRDTYLDGDRVRAKVFEVLNPTHAPILEIAKNDPHAFGFSIDALAVMNDRREVVDVRAVHSVDIVAEPATVAGVFEHVTTPDRKPNMEELIEKLTVEQITERRPDIVDDLTSDLREQLENARKRIEELEANQRKHAVEAAVAKAGLQMSDLDDDTRAALESCPVEHVTKIVEFFAARVSHPVSRAPGEGTDKSLDELIIRSFAN